MSKNYTAFRINQVGEQFVPAVESLSIDNLPDHEVLIKVHYSSLNFKDALSANGHPLGATGLAQYAELVWQLRGTAGNRQVENARIGLQHNIGLGRACVVTMFSRNE